MKTRMFAIAGALFLIPVGLGASQNPILDLWADGSVIIQDVEIFNPPQKKSYDPNEFYAEERLVEGHIVFATITFSPRYENATGNVTIDGVVHCEDHVEYDTFAGFIPYNIRRAQFECYTGQRVIITPDPFSGDPGSLTDLPLMQPTGRVEGIRTPDGQRGYIEELSFVHEGKLWYAWATPVFEPWTRDGKVKNFMAPLPIERLASNDIDDYHVFLEDE